MKKKYCTPEVTVKAVQVEDGFRVSSFRNEVLIMGCSEEFDESLIDLGTGPGTGGGMMEPLDNGGYIMF